MDFFEIGDVYNIEQNKVGIWCMLRLIWIKGNSDEGKGVQIYFIECYKCFFFEVFDSFSFNDVVNYIVCNMISLIFGVIFVEFILFEQLLVIMMKQGMIFEIVIVKFWQVYGVQKREILCKQRKGVIIVFGMLVIVSLEIVVGEMEIMLCIGFGFYGCVDLQFVKFICVVFRCINLSGCLVKEFVIKFFRLFNDYVVFVWLVVIIEVFIESKEWYGVVEQVINVIYVLLRYLDVLCLEIIWCKIKFVFLLQVFRLILRDELVFLLSVSLLVIQDGEEGDLIFLVFLI